MKLLIGIQVIAFLFALTSSAAPADLSSAVRPLMDYTDTDRGMRFAKDPDVIRFQDRYWMYYTILRPGEGTGIGIATSEDLTDWTKVGELLPQQAYEEKGLCAPGATLLHGRIHLFYQTYGNGPKDAICLAVSDDGMKFERHPRNPIFRPSGDWNCGRAIDADAIVFGDRLFLYCATRDPEFRVQMVTGAWAPVGADYGPEHWTQIGDGPLLKPELPWEKRCIEASTLLERNGRLLMFYAGAYNNEPQQIGVAISEDGVRWRRMSDQPLLPNGNPGEWNESESGHPGVFVDDEGATHLFFQGNNDRGKSWYLSRMRVRWDGDQPWLERPRDNHAFRLR